MRDDASFSQQSGLSPAKTPDGAWFPESWTTTSDLARSHKYAPVRAASNSDSHSDLAIPAHHPAHIARDCRAPFQDLPVHTSADYSIRGPRRQPSCRRLSIDPFESCAVASDAARFCHE